MAIWMFRSKRASASVSRPCSTPCRRCRRSPIWHHWHCSSASGSPGAVVVTFIYALPPLVRITAHALGTVASDDRRGNHLDGLDASQQLMTKVQLPYGAQARSSSDSTRPSWRRCRWRRSRRSLRDRGLGLPIVRALNHLNVGVAFVAGMCWSSSRSCSTERPRTRQRGRGGGARWCATRDFARTRLIGLAAITVVALYMSHTQLNVVGLPRVRLGSEPCQLA